MDSSSTMSGMDMPSSTSASDMSSMSMSTTSMTMLFFTSHTTPLFSPSWSPQTVGQYAGTCIFLIILSFLFRLMNGIKNRLEARWHAQSLKRRYIVTQPPTRTDPGTDGVREIDSDDEGDELRVPGVTEKQPSEAVLTANGVTERVKVVQGAHTAGLQPFRLSVDLTRACMATLMVGVGYLLMLAVMTMNVGYFMSVLAGAFLGELCFGRWSTHHTEEHH